MKYWIYICLLLGYGCTDKHKPAINTNTPTFVTPAEDVTLAVNALLPQPHLPLLQQAVKWNDAGGQNWLLLYQSGPFAPSEGWQHAAIAAELYIKTDSGFVRQWHYSDTVPACTRGAGLQFYPNHLSVADVDANGYADITLVYHLRCAAPTQQQKKLVLYERGRQYAWAGSAAANKPLPASGSDTSALQPAVLQHVHNWWQRFPAGDVP